MMTSMQRFDPFSETRRFRWRMGDPFAYGFGWRLPYASDGDSGHRFPINVRRDDDNLTVLAWLPGMEADDVDVTVTPDRHLSIKAFRKLREQGQNERYLLREHGFRSGVRTVNLPTDVNLDAAAVAMDNGVLTIVIPVDQSRQPRRLEIGAHGSADAG
jgi:HSP20 family molecular chaperone IbpA